MEIKTQFKSLFHCLSHVTTWLHLTGGDTRFCRESSKSRGFYDRGVKTRYPAGNKHGGVV